MSEIDKVVEEKIDREPDLSVPSFLFNAIKNIGFAPTPVPHASSWQIEPIDAELDDGTKKTVYFVTETVIRDNTITVYWYDADNLAEHINTANIALARLRATERASGQLVVANTEQMKQEAAASGLTVPRG